MPTLSLSKSDVRRALVRHHFESCACQEDAYARLRSVQFDPLAPVGCNHDLVMQARVRDYRIGDWQKLAYEDRHVYDGWDKMASLVPFEGWPLRRYIHDVHRKGFEKKIFEDHKEAVDAVLAELAERGPLMPKEFGFQQRREEWKGSWFGPSVTKQTLRALWHSGLIMTAGRKGGQHVYDLTERVVPKRLREMPLLPAADAIRELVMERHRAMGIVRPSAPYEVWSYSVMGYTKLPAIAELARLGEIVPVDVEGVKAHATPQFLELLDLPSLDPKVVFIAPLDQFMWDRKMIAHVFGFDYVWEVYVPEAKRRWGYYVLPVLFGDDLVARAEFWCRSGVLEIRRWHWEEPRPAKAFAPAFQKALSDVMGYASASTVVCAPEVEPEIRKLSAKVP